jgi:hypothetical protein
MLRRRHAFIAIPLLFASTAASATAQTPDEITFDGRTEMLFSEPLNQFLAVPSNWERFAPHVGTERCTGTWRGYKAAWEIRESRLLLRQVDVAPCEEKPKLVPLKTLFPLDVGTVPASWFTGTLVVPSGKLLNYIHMGYDSQYEHYTLFTVVQGLVVSRQEQSAPPK